MFGEKLHFLPQTPSAAIRSPYIDTQFFRDVHGPGMDRALPVIEARLETLISGFADLGDVDRAAAIRETARGVLPTVVGPLAAGALGTDRRGDAAGGRAHGGC